jgi:hypothetical protein
LVLQGSPKSLFIYLKSLLVLQGSPKSLFIYLFKVFIGLWWATMNGHKPTHHPLDAHYYSIVDEL